MLGVLPKNQGITHTKEDLAKCKVLKKVRWSSADDHLTF